MFVADPIPIDQPKRIGVGIGRVLWIGYIPPKDLASSWPVDDQPRFEELTLALLPGVGRRADRLHLSACDVLTPGGELTRATLAA